jgi:hypothetical protein
VIIRCEIRLKDNRNYKVKVVNEFYEGTKEKKEGNKTQFLRDGYDTIL